jgi:hypothetical protein
MISARAILVFPAALLVALVVRAQGKPADWKLFGIMKAHGQNVDIFYLASELRRNAAGHIEVWTKGVPTAAVNHVILDKVQVGNVADKFLSGYKPPAMRVTKATKDQVLIGLSAEEVANAGNVDPVNRVLFEMNCHDGTLRMLSFWEKLQGKANSDDTAGEWMHAPPETHFSTLMSSLCPTT